MSSSLVPEDTQTNDRQGRSQFRGVPFWGIGCALALLAAILVAHPYAETGIADDFSYVWIAKVLAQTGHIAYDGWVTPILGWQLYLAAVFIKLFGFSFTTTRASIVLVSMVTTFVCQRSLVHAGISEWNASIGTIALMFSPLVMPLEVTYMTDIPGLFALVLCLYACLRSIQSETQNGAIGWIGFAVLSNVVFGSSRQIAWLGVLVMVPSALWIMRERRRVFIVGSGLWVLGTAVVFSINHWFEQQPYTQVELLLPHPISLHALKQLPSQMLRACFEVVLLLLPILLMFLPALWRKKRPWQIYAAGMVFILAGLGLWHMHSLSEWFAPYLSGEAPFGTLAGFRPILTIAVVLCVLALIAVIFSRGEKAPVTRGGAPMPSDRVIATLLVPFTMAYVGLISPRAGFENIWDRYVLPLLFVAVIFLLRFYQQRLQARLPVATLVLAIGIGAYATATLHDRFAWFRANVAAVNEVLATGVPATSVSGGWNYDGWTELQLSGHIVDPRMRVPPGVTLPTPTHYGLQDCPWFYCNMFPHVVPHYTISFRPDPSLENTFAPVPYKTWIAPARTVYVVRFPDPIS